MTSDVRTTTFDVITIGRCGVDLYPLQSGVGLEDVETFGKFLGGSPTNVAVAASRLGSSAAVISGVGDDPFGRFVRREMRPLEEVAATARRVRLVAAAPYISLKFCAAPRSDLSARFVADSETTAPPPASTILRI